MNPKQFLIFFTAFVIVAFSFYQYTQYRSNANKENIAKAQAETANVAKDNDPYAVERTMRGIAPNSQGQDISFDDCKAKQSSMVLDLGGSQYKTEIIANTDIVSTIRVCTNDGSVLITCSALDGKLITTKSDGTGCN